LLPHLFHSLTPFTYFIHLLHSLIPSTLRLTPGVTGFIAQQEDMPSTTWVFVLTS